MTSVTKGYIGCDNSKETEVDRWARHNPREETCSGERLYGQYSKDQAVLVEGSLLFDCKICSDLFLDSR